MTLEILANELLLEIFEYLNTIHLLHAFHNLNLRFNTLISIHCRIYHFDYHGMSIDKLNEFFQEQLPLNINRVKSLHLIDTIDTLNLSKIFFQSTFSPQKFDYLQSLSLYQIDSIDKLHEIIDRCPNLEHLALIKCSIASNNRIDPSNLFNKIWSLSKLIYCFFQQLTPAEYQILDIRLVIISISIKYLYFYHSSTTFHPLDLLEYTPNLQRLHLDTFLSRFYRELKTNFLSINVLKMKLNSKIYQGFDYLQYMPNLYHLKLDIYTDKMIGDDWEDIITEYLPKLKKFQLKMTFSGLFLDSKYDYQKFLRTYQTSFWLKKYQSFVRCAECTKNRNSSITLYTLPYCFEDLDLKHVSWSISTCPNAIDYYSNRIHCLNSSEQQSDPNLFQITCQLAFKDKLNITDISSKIYRKSISFSNEIFSQTQVFLDHSLNYYSLTMFTESLDYKFSQLISKSIRQLIFLSHRPYSSARYYFNELDCQILINSSLAQQCESLSIPIKNKQYLPNFFEQLTYLQLLCIEFEEEEQTLSDDECILWLQKHLSSSYTIIKYQTTIPLWQGSYSCRQFVIKVHE